jgi:hypothetical protein
LKDSCVCLQLGDNRLSLALPHSLKVEPVAQAVERFCDVTSHFGIKIQAFVESTQDASVVVFMRLSTSLRVVRRWDVINRDVPGRI